MVVEEEEVLGQRKYIIMLFHPQFSFADEALKEVLLSMGLLEFVGKGEAFGGFLLQLQ